jgi:hypothetical protein
MSRPPLNPFALPESFFAALRAAALYGGCSEEEVDSYVELCAASIVIHMAIKKGASDSQLNSLEDTLLARLRVTAPLYDEDEILDAFAETTQQALMTPAEKAAYEKSFSADEKHPGKLLLKLLEGGVPNA